MPGQPGESAFQVAYAPLLALVEAAQAANLERDNPNSMRSLVESYLASDEWLQLATKTRNDYRRELDRLCVIVGALPYASLAKEGVRALRKQVKAMTVASRQAAIATRAIKDFLDNDAWIEKAAKRRAAGKPPPARPKSKRKPPLPITNTTGARTADYFTTVLSALIKWAMEYGQVNSNPVETIKKKHCGKKVKSRKAWTDYQIQYAIDHAPLRQ